MKHTSQTCIGILDNESEDANKYCVGWKEEPCMKQTNESSWHYHKSTTASRIVEYLLDGSMISSGYVTTLSLNLLEAKRRIKELKKQSWINRYTRKIEVKSFLRMLDTNSVITVNIRVEFLPTGNKKQSHEIQITQIDNNILKDWSTVLSYAILSMASLIWILGFIKQLILQNFSYLNRFKRLNKLAFALSIISIIAISFARNKSLTTIKASKNTSTVYESFNEVILCDKLIKHFISILGLCLLLYLLQLLMFIDSIAKAVRTLKESICRTFSTVVFVLLGIIAISSFAHLKFCYIFSEFNTLREALLTTFEMLIKGYSFGQFHSWTFVGLVITLSVIVIRSTAIACFIAASQTVRRKVSHGKTTIEQRKLIPQGERVEFKRKKDEKQTNVCFSKKTTWKAKKKLYKVARIAKQVDENNSSFSNLKILDEQSTRQMFMLTEYLNEIYLDKISWELGLIETFSRLNCKVRERKRSSSFGLFNAVPHALPLCTIKIQKSQKPAKKKLKSKKRSRRITSQSGVLEDDNKLQLPRMHAFTEESTNDEARKAARSRLFSLGISLGSLQAALARARRNNAQRMIKTNSEVLADEMMEFFRARSRSHSHSDVESQGNVERRMSHEQRDFNQDEDKNQQQPAEVDSCTDTFYKGKSSNSETHRPGDSCEANETVHYSKQNKLKRKQHYPCKRESSSINIEFDAEFMK
eukprot:Seg7369.2 transcript_id=Seg7369.2/GoldUCD/mRNA.D3Y31 product=Polycystin-2 protein_id=Seg7369.2/GoldUCD/D3Y31